MGIAQIFAANYANRLTSLVLTNCDVHDGRPPPQVVPLMEHARNGTLAPIFQPMLDSPRLARARHAKGEAVPLFRSYADPSILTDEIIRLYLEVEDARLFFAEDRPDALAAPVLELWSEWSEA